MQSSSDILQLMYNIECNIQIRCSSECCTRNGITELSQRAPPIFGWAAITMGIGQHSSFNFIYYARPME